MEMNVKSRNLGISDSTHLVDKFQEKGDLEIGFKLEDWAFLLSLAIAATLVIIPGVGLMGFVYAVPVLTFASIRSLFKAPEELLLNYETR